MTEPKGPLPGANVCGDNGRRVSPGFYECLVRKLVLAGQQRFEPA